MSVIGGSIVDKTILFPMSTNLKIQQLRQILILKPDKHIIATCDKYHEWKQNALTQINKKGLSEKVIFKLNPEWLVGVKQTAFQARKTTWLKIWQEGVWQIQIN